MTSDERRELVFAEREFPDPMTKEGLAEMFASGGWCLELYGVKHLTTYLSRDGRRAVCVFEAPDAETVRNVNRTVQVPFTRVWSGTLHEPG